MGNNDLKIEMKKKIYGWTIDLVNFVDGLSKTMSVKIIASQLMRSGTSIGANYIEAQAASSRKDFTNFIHHSLKSANESRFWLALLRDTEKADKNRTEALLKKLEEICKILGASLLTPKISFIRALTRM